MAEPQFAVVVTTIGAGEFLDVYARKIAEEGLLERTTMFVIPDRKTPAALGEAVARARLAGLRIECPDLQAQERYLADLGMIGEFIPWNSDARRNIGFLMAYQSAAEVIVAVDDDNLCELPGPWLTEHSVVADPATRRRVIESASGWYNPCTLLESDPPLLYPRGYPFAQRGGPPPLTMRAVEARIDINAGLWLGVPDVDAFTHLAGPTHTTALREPSLVLAPGTWAPVNTQNSAIRRDAMAAWWFPRMGHMINGLNIARFGDILSGYFLLACARQVGGCVRFGTPLVIHRRNAHDFARDALGELPGIWITEELVAWLQRLRLSGNDYVSAYRALADELDAFAATHPSAFWTESVRFFLYETTRGMRAWAEAICLIDGRARGA